MALLPQKKSIQIYILALGCVLFVVVGYFRFIHKKPSPAARPIASFASLDQLQVPRVELDLQSKMQTPKLPGNESLHTLMRDIFSPLMLTSMGQNPSEVQAPGGRSSTMTLMGTVIDSGKPLAVINDQFVGTGDWIGEYQVLRIDKNTVLLDSGNRQIKLEMVKDE